MNEIRTEAQERKKLERRQGQPTKLLNGKDLTKACNLLFGDGTLPDVQNFKSSNSKKKKIQNLVTHI